MKHLLLIASLLLGACSSGDEPPPPKKAPEGRAETRAIRNTEAVGYSGKAIADKVDKALKANDDQIKKASQDSQESPSEQPPPDQPQP